MNRVFHLLLIMALGAAAPVMAQSGLKPLRDVESINAGLIDVQIADLIRHNCASIEGRVIKGLLYFQRLYSEARAMGYDHATIEAFVDDEAERARVDRAAWTYLTAQGVERGQPVTFCTAGMREINTKSRVGSFLIAR